MHVDASLDIDMITIHTHEELCALIELRAPAAPSSTARQPSTLVVVLDRSGSMSGPRIEHAKLALCELVDRLAPGDRFGLVTFDDRAEVPVPAAVVSDRAVVKQAIAGVSTRGTTDLAAGYLRGLQEARRVAGPSGATVLLISDGHANRGETSADALASIASTSASQGVSTSALGMGLGYDETLLSAIARGGRGNELFAEDADAAGAQIAGEVEHLMSQSVQAASLLVTSSRHVQAVAVLNELDSAMTPDGLLIELGGFYAEETRKLLLTFAVPGIEALGPVEVAGLQLRYVEMSSLEEHVVTIALHVDVVTGDKTAARIANPAVTTEVAFQTAQRAKRSANRNLVLGDPRAALGDLESARSAVHEAMAASPADVLSDLREESAVLDAMVRETEFGSATRASKLLSADVSHKSSKRGRRRPSS
ncbi:MAG: VWA domain-containing protein [Actinomycetota bacterium]|nr:VWA domain-containing protein [Actinomycetota bacterium]